jgi:hypothetical protein
MATRFTLRIGEKPSKKRGENESAGSYRRRRPWAEGPCGHRGIALELEEAQRLPKSSN